MSKYEKTLAIIAVTCFVLYFAVAVYGSANKQHELYKLKIERTQLEIKILKGQCK